jgi:hypothetical protein
MRTILNTLAWCLMWPVAHYIRWHRDHLRPNAQPLSPAQITCLAPYFESSLLDSVRVCQQDPLPLADPPFTGILRRLGFSFPGLSSVSAITLGHLIATRQPMSHTLLFHEMVHVVQFQQLGIRDFSRLYVRGFLATGSYEDIPLEACAYTLEARFTLQKAPFPVKAEVQQWNY